MITKADFLQQLQKAISLDEWKQMQAQQLNMNAFNRSVLLEMKDAVCQDEQEVLDEKEPADLAAIIEAYLGEYLKEQPDAWKWIILSCLYLTFFAKRPMHPLDAAGVQVKQAEGKIVYECPYKTEDPNTTCYYCVCIPMAEAAR